MNLHKRVSNVTKKLQNQLYSRLNVVPKPQNKPGGGETIDWSVNSQGRRFGRVNPFANSENLAFAIERVPIKSIASHSWSDAPYLQPYGVAETFGINPKPMTESDIGYAATTPILGQYRTTLGFPDDWSWYWEYMDSRLFVPEAAFASKLKSQLIWKNGFEFDTDKKSAERLQKIWDRYHLTERLQTMSTDALEYGQGYDAIIDNSVAVWDGASGTEMDYMVDSSGNYFTALRPLLSWTPATDFLGLKQLDPRTMRIQANPSIFDTETASIQIEKYVQRSQYGQAGGILGRNEIDLHPEQVLLLQFNKIGGGIYGYSIYREVMFALKSYLIMHHYLPYIVQYRAEPWLHFQYGGDVKEPGGETITKEFTDAAIKAKEQEFSARQPGQNLHTDLWTNIKPILTDPALSGVAEIVRGQKERVLLGLNIPMSIAVLSQSGAEVKWGALNYTVVEDEITSYHRTIEELVNTKIIPRLTSKDITFQFHQLHEEDWHGDIGPLLALYQASPPIISADYIRKRLKMPPDSAATPEQLRQDQQQPQNRGFGGGGGQGGLATKPEGTPGTPAKPKERRRITTPHGKKYIVEDIEENA